MGNSDSITYYEEHKIPPDEKLTEEYRISTVFGKADPNSKVINSASQLPLENKRFGITSKASQFSINGEGFSLFYKIVKFGVWGIIVCLVPLAVTLMLIYSTGNDCGKSLKAVGSERLLFEGEGELTSNYF